MKPSIAIFRPVMNIGQEQLMGFRDALDQEGLLDEYTKVTSIDDDNRGFELNSTFVSPGELRCIQDYCGDLSEDEVDDMADYLADTLPDSFNRSIVVPTLPVEIHPSYRRSMRNRRTLLVGNSQQLKDERAFVQGAMQEYLRRLGLPDFDLHENDWLTSANVAYIKSKESEAKAQQIADFLQSTPGILPVEIEYGGIVVGDA